MPDYFEVEEDSAVEMDSSDSEASSSNGARSTNSGLSSTSSGINSSQSSMYDYHHQQATHVGDHSYTLPKKFYDTNSLGVQTPSDSGKFTINQQKEIHSNVVTYNPRQSFLDIMTHLFSMYVCLYVCVC